MRKRRARWGILKNPPRAPGGNCAQEGACPRHERNLVRRRGPHRPEEQDPPPLGQAWHPSKRTAGPTDRFHLHLRCSLPEGGQGCSPDHAGLQHRGDELAPRRDRRNRRARCPRHPPGRSSRLALVHPSPRAGQYHHHSAAAEVPRAQPGRERLAVHARQLALQPHLQILRRSRRPLLCGMEQARRSALAHHVHRTAPMGPRVLINGIWYKTSILAFVSSLAPLLNRFQPSEIYAILRQNGCLIAVDSLADSSPLRRLVQAVLHQDIEGAERLLRDLGLEGLDDAEIPGSSVDEPKNDEIVETVASLSENEAGLPDLRPVDILSGLDDLERSVVLSDTETIEFLITNAVGRLWSGLLRAENFEQELAELRTH